MSGLSLTPKNETDPVTFQLRFPLPDGGWSEWQNVVSPWDGSRNPVWEYRPLYARHDGASALSPAHGETP